MASLVTNCIRAFWVCLVAFDLNGCAYLKPYVPLNPTHSAPSTGNMPQLSTSVNKLDAWLKATEDLRDSTSTTQRTLNLMTFGFGLSAAIAGVYEAHRDTIVGLGLGAGTTYTGSALFVPADQTTLYNTAIKSLTCIRTKASALRAAVDSAESRRTGDLRRGYLHEQLQPHQCLPPASLKAALDSAERARAKAVAALDGARTADPTAADKTSDAGLNVVTALNEELTKRAASADAILGAGKSIVGIATGISGAPPTAPKAAPKAAPKPKAKPVPAPACTAPSVEDFQALDAKYRAVEAILDGALNSIAALDTACVFNAPAIPHLTVSQEEITLAADASYVVTISGGRPPYFAEWIHAQPTGVSRHVLGSALVLSVGASAISGSEYTLDVVDGSLIPSRKSIKVKVK